MAKVLEGQEVWSAKVRCAEAAGYSIRRVDGCFALLEVGLDDIVVGRDSENDPYLYMHCPSCGQRLHVGWQLGEGAIARVLERQPRKRRQK
jgi:hypothetical protein